MNIKAINCVDSKSGVSNKNRFNKSDTHKNNSNSSLNDKGLNSISFDILKVYNPNISFGSNKADERVSLSREAVNAIDDTIKYILGREDSQQPSVFMPKDTDGEISKEDLIDLLKIDDIKEYSVAHNIALIQPELYIEITESLSLMERYKLLRIKDESGWTVANALFSDKNTARRMYEKATVGFVPDQVFGVLKNSDEDGNTVAYCIAAKNRGLCVDAMEGFSNKERFELLRYPNKWGKTLAHEIAHDIKLYDRATEDLSSEQKYELFNLKDKFGQVVIDIYNKRVW